MQCISIESNGLKTFLAAIALLLGIIFLGVAVVAGVASLSPGGPHVDFSTFFRRVAIIAAPPGILFLGLGWAILAKRDA